MLARRPNRIRYTRISLSPATVDRRAYFILDPKHRATLLFSEAAERILATAAERRVFWVTGTGSGRGTSLISLNLASALAVDGRVALVDARFESPGLGRLLGLEDGHSIEKAYAARQESEDATFDANLVGNRLVFLPTYGGVGSEVFGTTPFGTIVADLRKTCDFVLVDGPPVRSLLERQRLLQHVDGLIVVTSPADLATGLFEQTLAVVNGHSVMGCFINENTSL